MTMQIPDCPKAHPDAVLREEFAGQYLLFHLDSGAMLGINQTGAFIWRLLDGRACLTDITDRMVSFFKVSPATARKDLAAFLEKLAANDLLAGKHGEAA
jgi:hypothetical protein